MAIRKVVDLSAESTVSFEKPGQKVQGYYIGFKTVSTSFGPSKLHVLQGEGGTVGVWGSAQLDSKLGTVPKGALTFITYLKKTKVPKGTLKNFDVEYDDEEMMDVGNTAVNLSAEPADESGTPDEGNDESGEQADCDPEETEAEEEIEEAAPVQTAPPKKGTPAPISQSTKTKAQEILQKARAAAAAKGTA